MFMSLAMVHLLLAQARRSLMPEYIEPNLFGLVVLIIALWIRTSFAPIFLDWQP
jgi:hypothetical protein